MNRGLFGFLVFLGALVFGLGVVGYVLGPNRLAFVFHAERRTEPVVIVELLEFVDAEHDPVYQNDFARPELALIRALGGEGLWRAGVGEVVTGQASDAWSMLDVVRYPSRAAFIELVTSADYRALGGVRDAAVKRGALFAAAPLLDLKAGLHARESRYHVVRMFAGAHDDSIDVYATKWLAQDEQLLQHHGGELNWRARLSPLVADPDERFDEMQIYGFRDADGRRDWIADMQRQTQRTLQRRLFRRDVLLFVDARIDAEDRPSMPPEAANVPVAERNAEATAEEGALDNPN